MATIKQLPPDSRPRERLASEGASGLSEAELLAILLGTGAAKKSALDLAHEVLAKFGDVAALSSAKPSELCELVGVGQSKAAQILAGVELGRRVLGSQRKPRARLSSAKEACDYLSAVLKGLGKEHFVVLYLDAKNKLLGRESISVGTLDSVHAHPREVFTGAVAARAKSVIVAHNHPSGDPAPSKEDKEITRRLQVAGKVLGIELLDHIIVGNEKCVSMKEEGHWVE